MIWPAKVSSFIERLSLPLNKVLYGIGLTMLVGMMLLTTTDVILRYFFSRPILGALELTEFMMAIIAFLSLGYTALRKGHIIVDAVTSRLSPRVRAIFDIITIPLSIGFFSLVTWRLFLYAENLRSAGAWSPALHLPQYPFVLLATMGSALICLVLLANLFETLAKLTRTYHQFWLWVLAIGALTALVFTVPVWWAHFPWKLSPIDIGVIGLGVLVLLLVLGMPIGISMGLIGFLGVAILSSTNAGLTLVGTAPYSAVASYSLSVIPLFTLMGALCFVAGLSEELYLAAYKWIGHWPGGLAMATVMAAGGFAGVCGSSTASAITIGMVALPEMKKYKYDDALATGVIAAGGTLGILIPPSIVFSLYGILTEQSIGKLFLAGFIPGLFEAALYMGVIYFLCKRNPQLGPPGPATRFTEKIVALKGTWGVLALFLLVMGGIYLGIMTATEAAGVGSFGALIFALGKRKLTWKHFKDALLDTGKLSSMCFLIMMGSMVFNYFLAVSRLPFEMASLIGRLPLDRYVILSFIIILYLILGCFMPVIPLIILTVPIFFPVIVALGFDPIWFGVIIVMIAEVAVITPPVGVNVFVVKAVARDVPMYTIFRGIIPFLIADMFRITILIVFPQMALFLPSLMK